MLTVIPTHDSAYLRRWMLRPAFVRKMGAEVGAPQNEAAFDAVMASDAAFFEVRDDGAEAGCIVFLRLERYVWELHVCLATWWTKTRVAVKEAIAQLAMRGATVTAKFPDSRRACNRLLDDLGFATGTVADGLRIRTLEL